MIRLGLWLSLFLSFGACGGEPDCGDGDLWLNTEECDDGNLRDRDGCDKTCRLEDGLSVMLGGWRTNFGSTMTISQEAWGDAQVRMWLATDRIVIVRQPDSAEWNPGTFSKIVYTELAGDTFYFCEIAFGKETTEDALNDEAIANAEDPAERGCGEFGWTRLTRVVEPEIEP